jgi:cytochrome c oxidase cbb3-type subunit 4
MLPKSSWKNLTILDFESMLRDVISSVDYSLAAEIALGLFVVAFTIMAYGTMRLSRRTTDRFASIPLSDRVEDPRNGK